MTVTSSTQLICFRLSLRVILLQLLDYPYFELDIKKDEIRKALLIKQETEKLNGFAPFCQFLVTWSNS